MLLSRPGLIVFGFNSGYPPNFPQGTCACPLRILRTKIILITKHVYRSVLQLRACGIFNPRMKISTNVAVPPPTVHEDWAAFMRSVYCVSGLQPTLTTLTLVWVYLYAYVYRTQYIHICTKRSMRAWSIYRTARHDTSHVHSWTTPRTVSLARTIHTFGYMLNCICTIHVLYTHSLHTSYYSSM